MKRDDMDDGEDGADDVGDGDTDRRGCALLVGGVKSVRRGLARTGGGGMRRGCEG
jgi:hypothetical protein